MHSSSPDLPSTHASCVAAMTVVGSHHGSESKGGSGRLLSPSSAALPRHSRARFSASTALASADTPSDDAVCAVTCAKAALAGGTGASPMISAIATSLRQDVSFVGSGSVEAPNWLRRTLEDADNLGISSPWSVSHTPTACGEIGDDQSSHTDDAEKERGWRSTREKGRAFPRGAEMCLAQEAQTSRTACSNRALSQPAMR